MISLIAKITRICFILPMKIAINLIKIIFLLPIEIVKSIIKN